MFSVQDIESRMTGAAERRRVEEILRRESMTLVRMSDNMCSTKTTGARGKTYSTTVWINLEGRCDCRAWRFSKERKYCKHVLAAAYLWLDSLLEQPKIEIDDFERAMWKMTDADCRRVLERLAREDPVTRQRVIDLADDKSA